MTTITAVNQSCGGTPPQDTSGRMCTKLRLHAFILAYMTCNLCSAVTNAPLSPARTQYVGAYRFSLSGYSWAHFSLTNSLMILRQTWLPGTHCLCPRRWTSASLLAAALALCLLWAAPGSARGNHRHGKHDMGQPRSVQARCTLDCRQLVLSQFSVVSGEYIAVAMCTPLFLSLLPACLKQ